MKGHSMPRLHLLAMAVALCATTTVATAQNASMLQPQGHAPMSPADLREQLHFPPEMEVNFFGNMRGHMQTLDGILQAVAAGDFAGASRIASERLGLDSPSAAGCKPSADSGASKGAMTKPSNASAPLSMDEMMARYMPDPMRAIGLSMHTAASNFAVVAAQSAASHDTTATLAALSKVTQNCVACHAAYRLR